MRAVLGVLPLLAIALFSTGCRNCQLVEAELRHQTQKVEELEGRLQLKEGEVNALEATLANLKAELSERGSTAPPETVYKNVGISKISLGPATGGRDVDRDGKDDGLRVMVVPQDYDGDPLKAPGSITVEAQEILSSGEKRPLDSWAIDKDELRRSWRATLLGSGYQLDLPWKKIPGEKMLRVITHFLTLDGRTFHAEKDIAVSRTPKGPPAEGTELKAPLIQSIEPMLGEPLEETSINSPGEIEKTAAWRDAIVLPSPRAIRRESVYLLPIPALRPKSW